MTVIYYWLLINLVFLVVLYIGKKRMDHLRKLRDSKEATSTPVVNSSPSATVSSFSEVETLMESKKV